MCLIDNAGNAFIFQQKQIQQVAFESNYYIENREHCYFFFFIYFSPWVKTRERIATILEGIVVVTAFTIGGQTEARPRRLKIN